MRLNIYYGNKEKLIIFLFHICGVRLGMTLKEAEKGKGVEVSGLICWVKEGRKDLFIKCSWAKLAIFNLLV